jgi:hypothetical protein
MKNNPCRLLCLLILFGTIDFVHSQEGTIMVKQNPKLDSLFLKKIELDRNRYSTNYFTLQLYYGNLEMANKIIEISNNNYPNISVELSFETPNYKVQAGKFKNKIKGLKTLDTIKKVFPSAFLLMKKESL